MTWMNKCVLRSNVICIVSWELITTFIKLVLIFIAIIVNYCHHYVCADVWFGGGGTGRVELY